MKYSESRQRGNEESLCMEGWFLSLWGTWKVWEAPCAAFLLFSSIITLSFVSVEKIQRIWPISCIGRRDIGTGRGTAIKSLCIHRQSFLQRVLKCVQSFMHATASKHLVRNQTKNTRHRDTGKNQGRSEHHQCPATAVVEKLLNICLGDPRKRTRPHTAMESRSPCNPCQIFFLACLAGIMTLSGSARSLRGFQVLAGASAYPRLNFHQ